MPGIRLDIPGFGPLAVHHLVTDYSGTLACGGRVSAEVLHRLARLSEIVEIHVVTSDTFGTVRRELGGLPSVRLHLLEGGRHDERKEAYVRRLDPATVVVFGNGSNDRLLLKAVKEEGGLSVVVDNGEGCALDAVLHAHILIRGIVPALDLLLEPQRCKATLRR